MTSALTEEELPSLLLVDDDLIFCKVLSGALKKRGFAVSVAHDVESALLLAQAYPPEYAVIDLKMPVLSGLVLVEKLKQLDDQTRILMLTGYASITTAVEAIKLGATYYLAKPVDADEVVAALGKDSGDAHIAIQPPTFSVGRIEWEHIQKILAENQGNISSTARALKMHRRTLQRKLNKNPAQA